MLAALAVLSLAYGDSRLFAAPTVYTPPMAQSQMRDALAFSTMTAPYVQIAENTLPLEPVEPLRSAPYVFAVDTKEPASPSLAAYAVAGAILLGGVAAIRPRAPAVAEPDLEAATSAVRLANVATLLTFGKNSTAKPKAGGRKPAPKKAVRGSAKPTNMRGSVKPTNTRRGGPKKEPTEIVDPGLSLYYNPNSKPVGFIANFFTEKNWIYQLVTTIQKLPGSEKNKTNVF
jgi:hypothetical protein